MTRKQAKFRRIFFTSLFVITISGLSMLMGSCVAKHSASSDIEYQEYIVKSGDKLWSIAREHTPNSNIDIRDVIYMIQDKNGIDNIIHCGDVLLIPKLSDI